MESLLEIQELHIQFQSPRGTLEAVRGASLQLHLGETLALVGESGCGKSVLCKSVLGLLSGHGRVTAGKILFDGCDLTTLTEKQLRPVRGREIGMVFQNPSGSFNPIAPVGKQIARAALADQISRAQSKRRTAELLELVGLEPAVYERYPHQLSGGMLQRCALAAALACSPKVLLADEPTSALDVTVQERILTLMQRIQRETGVAILFVTHDLGAAAQLADRIAVMYAGQIVETGAVDEVFDDPRHSYTKGLLAALPRAHLA